jgi:hypothetical protein
MFQDFGKFIPFLDERALTHDQSPKTNDERQTAFDERQRSRTRVFDF